jgi:hypothetical protein
MVLSALPKAGSEWVVGLVGNTCAKIEPQVSSDPMDTEL